MRITYELALARQVFITLLFLSSALVQGVYGIEISASGLSNGESSSVGLNLDLSPDATLEGEIAFDSAALIPSTAISGPVSKFEETHAVKDSSGKSASVSVNVVNAPNGLTYRSLVLPQEGAIAVQPWVSAEQWLTIPKADSIKTTSSASYSTRSADVSLEEVKSSTAGDYVTLTDYYGKAYASVNQVEALQTAAGGSARSIRLYGQANDGTESLSIDTSISGLSSSAKFTSLTASASAGASTQVTQEESIEGRFTSTAKSGTRTKTRTSNYGSQFDLNMQAQKGSTPTGHLGYYVNPGMATTSSGAIQGAIKAAESGDTINANPGIYKENIAIDKTLNLKGAGAGSTIIDGQRKGTAITVGRANPNVHVYLSGLSITGGLSNYGGGISNLARLTVSDSTISGNTANYWGGGIRNQGTLIVARSSISGNSAINGGGIENDGTATLIDSTISSNTAKGFGGGIQNTGQLTSDRSSILSNTASHGSGISSSGTATVNSNKISNNRAGQGGGIESTGSLTVTGSLFSGNTAADAGSGICNKGTGIATVTGSTFSGNTGKFGTVYNAPTSKLTLTGVDISGNSADFGGAVDNDGTLMIKDCVMTDNIAGDGGAIYNHGTVAATGCTISRNVAEDRFYLGVNNPGQGGGIHNHGTATVTDCTISGNSANAGGGIWNKAGLKLTLKDSDITSNTADYGGGVCNEGILDMIGSTISGNSASLNPGSSGGGIGNYGTDSVLNLYSGSIDNNIARNYGGGIRNAGTVNILANYPTISIDHNTAAIGGGISSKGVVNGLPYPWGQVVHDNTPNP